MERINEIIQEAFQEAEKEQLLNLENWYKVNLDGTSLEKSEAFLLECTMDIQGEITCC